MMVCCTVFIQLRKSVTKYIHRMHSTAKLRVVVSGAVRSELSAEVFTFSHETLSQQDSGLAYHSLWIRWHRVPFFITFIALVLFFGAHVVMLKLPELAGIFAFFKHFTQKIVLLTVCVAITRWVMYFLFVDAFLHLIFSILISILISHCCHLGWVDTRSKKH